MFLSQHDYEVVLWVVAVAGVVTLVFAWLVARLTFGVPARCRPPREPSAMTAGSSRRTTSGELADLRVS